jgi:hypothetical protein
MGPRSNVRARPFSFFQVSDGWHLRSAPIWTYNSKNDIYSVSPDVPVGQFWSGDALQRELSDFEVMQRRRALMKKCSAP